MSAPLAAARSVPLGPLAPAALDVLAALSRDDLNEVVVALMDRRERVEVDSRISRALVGSATGRFAASECQRLQAIFNAAWLADYQARRRVA